MFLDNLTREFSSLPRKKESIVENGNIFDLSIEEVLLYLMYHSGNQNFSAGVKVANVSRLLWS